VRRKRAKPSAVPAKYQCYRPEEWPGGWGEFIEEREEWNAAQEPVIIAGVHHDGRAYAYPAGPLGDFTDLVKARREARLTGTA
jgi:hypothetical protein